MKKATALILILVFVISAMVGCSTIYNDSDGLDWLDGMDEKENNDPQNSNNQSLQNSQEAQNPSSSQSGISNNFDETFGEDLNKSEIYDGYFENDIVDIDVQCISGTANAYTLNNNILTFTSISEDSVYSISGQLSGNIIIDTGNDFKFELEMTGLSIVSKSTNPIVALSGNKVTLTAKKDTKNYIYDKRETVDETDTTLTKGAINSDVDLQIGGKGALTVVSDNNNGIHTKDDLEVKNLTLSVTCCDNALKGNDSVEILGGALTLISTQGDGIKTTNSDISDKGNQRGDISISEARVNIYAACDGIDASHNALVDGETAVLNIYTDKYSSYSEEVTANSESVYYIRYSSNAYKYSVKYYNSASDFEWVNATYHSSVSGNRSSYYYYSVPKKAEFSKMKFFMYSSSMEQSQETNYTYATEYLTPNTTYDTLALSSRGSSISSSWTNYTTTVQDGPGGAHGGMNGGPGGMNEGNSDKGDYSTKGIKAANEIIFNNGTITVKSYDDAIHANNTTVLENSNTPLGNITVNGGTLSLYSNDDGIHADGNVVIKGGKTNIVNSYEGIEGNTVTISGGDVSVSAKDDGVNASATSGTNITLSGGYLYIYCTGDGIDSNSKASYSAISFEGGDAIIIANSNGNSSIDSDGGYKYTAGSIVAIMPNGGMTNESTHCSNFSSVGTSKTMSLTSGKTLTISGSLNKTLTMPCNISNAFVVILNKSTSVS